MTIKRVKVVRGAKDVQGDRLPLDASWYLLNITKEIAVITDKNVTYFVKREFIKEGTK